MTEPIRILILEDNPVDAELVQFELQDAGFIITAKVVMTEADYTRELIEFNPDLILSDYDLPRYNGALALAEAAAIRPDTPFILVTGAVSEDRAIEMLTQGAKDYVFKSRLQQRLAPAVRRALEEAEEHRALKKAEAELHESHRTLEERVKNRTAELEAALAAQKRMEEELRESENRLRVAYQAAKIGTFDWNVRTGINVWTPELETMYGLESGEFGRTQPAWEQLVHPDDREFAVGLVGDTFKTGEPVEGTWRVVWKDGSIHWITGRFQAFKNSEGEPLRLSGINMDITERKQAEEEVRVSRNFLKIANQHRRLDELLQEFAKEIREISQCEAVGIRLRDRDGNIPYLAYTGFSLQFYEQESPLSLKTDRCMCINVVKGTTDPNLPFYTKGGSFYMNGTSRFMAIASDEEKREFRNVCNRTGYESVALIPIRVGSDILGLIHLADRKENKTPLEMVTLMEQVVESLGVGIQRSLANEELYRQHELLQVTLASIGDAVIATDTAGLVTFLNPVAESLTGWRLPEALDRPIKDVFKAVNETTRTAVESPVDKVLANGMVVGLANHTILVRKDGIEIPVDDSGAPIRDADGKTLGVVLVFRDISESKALDKVQTFLAQVSNFQKDESFFEVLARYIAESLRMDYVCIDRLEGDGLNARTVAVWHNGQFEDNVTYALKDTPCGALVGKEVCCFPTAVCKLFPHDEALQDLKAESYVGVTLFDHMGEPIGLIAVIGRSPMQNRTLAEKLLKLVSVRAAGEMERMAAENALTEQAQKLEEANRELESFSYSVSHDLRAPLRAIDGYSRMILKREGAGFGDETQRQFQMIRDNVDKMGHLIDDLLAFSRLGRQEVTRERLDMGSLVRGAWEELAAIHPDQAMTMQQDVLPSSLGDRALIRQVYANLLSNAVKFSQGKNPALIEAGSFVTGDETIYYVKDNGIGFDMQYHDRLFDVFQRLHGHAEYEGTGIGLALVKRIIQRHGGRIWAEGEPDKGASFYFTLAPERD